MFRETVKKTDDGTVRIHVEIFGAESNWGVHIEHSQQTNVIELDGFPTQQAAREKALQLYAGMAAVS